MLILVRTCFEGLCISEHVQLFKQLKVHFLTHLRLCGCYREVDNLFIKVSKNIDILGHLYQSRR